MKILQAIAVVALVLLAGCSGIVGDSGPRTTFDLTVQNDGSTSIPFTVTVTDEAGEVVSEESDQFASGVGGTFDLAIEGSGKYTVVVTGDGWETSHQVDADLCERYEATTTITDEETSSSSECTISR
jgi:hypothetical protein